TVWLRVTSHTVLSDIGTNTHPQIDTHLAATGTAAHGATSANTASQLVVRDASGNFSAGTVTATLIGNVTGNVTGHIIRPIKTACQEAIAEPKTPRP
ncbi:MAG: hypothetical protein HGB05_13345, partial [Chloroflexi bacterium]|nr:hypothetical protein [Chloroflexota bacterium]